MADVVDTLLSRLRSPDESERRWAAEDLAQFDGAPVVSALAAALADESVAVREAAAQSLSVIGGPEVCGVAIALLESDEAHVRNYAVEILEAIGEPAARPLVALSRSDSPDLRKFAMDILGSIGEAPGAGVMEACLERLADADPNVRAAAAEALGNLGDPQALPSLEAAFPSAGAWSQCHIALAAARIGGPEAAAVLGRLAGAPGLPADVKMHLGMAKAMLKSHSPGGGACLSR